MKIGTLPAGAATSAYQASMTASLLQIPLPKAPHSVLPHLPIDSLRQPLACREDISSPLLTRRQPLPPLLERLEVVFAAHSLWGDGRIVNPLSVKQGIYLVWLIDENLPPWMDLLDIFARLDFGPWKEEGEKDINASLRSFGKFGKADTRWEGSKVKCLLHPLSNRLSELDVAMDLLKSGYSLPDRTWDRLANIVPRLRVELFVIDRYLCHPEWMEALWPEESHRVYGIQNMSNSCTVGRKAIQSYHEHLRRIGTTTP